MHSPSKPDEKLVLDRYQMRVLVIEDNQDLAKLFCDLLEVMGCVTDVAFSARSGLESARANVPDIVFCDLRLPGEKSGLDFARELHADPALSHIPLIAVTGYASSEDAQRAKDAGFALVFEKPVKFAQMQEVLNNYRKDMK